MKNAFRNLDTFWMPFWSDFGTLPPSKSGKNARRYANSSVSVFSNRDGFLEHFGPLLPQKPTLILDTLWAPIWDHFSSVWGSFGLPRLSKMKLKSMKSRQKSNIGGSGVPFRERRCPRATKSRTFSKRATFTKPQ